MARPHVHVSIHICCNDFTANTKLHMMRQATIVFLKQYHSKRGAHVWVSLSMSQGLLGHVQGAGAPPPPYFFHSQGLRYISGAPTCLRGQGWAHVTSPCFHRFSGREGEYSTISLQVCIERQITNSPYCSIFTGH